MTATVASQHNTVLHTPRGPYPPRSATMRRFRAVLLALVMMLATVGLTITTSSSAQAANCSGTLIKSYPRLQQDEREQDR